MPAPTDPIDKQASDTCKLHLGTEGGSGRLWEALGSSGRLWEALGGFGKLWEALGSSGSVLRALTPRFRVLSFSMRIRAVPSGSAGMASAIRCISVSPAERGARQVTPGSSIELPGCKSGFRGRFWEGFWWESYTKCTRNLPREAGGKAPGLSGQVSGAF